jgi:K+-sensing histidine kinase KdpD
LEPVLGVSTPYVTLLPLVAFSAWVCGLGPSILIVILGLLGTKYWFIEPVHSFRILSAADSFDLLALLVASIAIVAMGEASRRKNERLLKAQGELEERVKQPR